jgi:ABC-type Na+ efflux pump permease subunit
LFEQGNIIPSLNNGNIMGTFLLALLGLLVWMALGIFVAFCVSAGNKDAGRRH